MNFKKILSESSASTPPQNGSLEDTIKAQADLITQLEGEISYWNGKYQKVLKELTELQDLTDPS